MWFHGNEVVVATRNKGKVKEFARMFEQIGIHVRSLDEYEGLPDIVEDGETFADNAMKKATTIANVLCLPVLADDSGLCVNALNGEPGVYSARYAGEHATDEENNHKLLRTLQECGSVVQLGAANEHPKLLSGAQFICALALYDPLSNRKLQTEGQCEGYMIEQPRGDLGFGYDPIFYLPAFGQTMAELSMEQKNQISHRGAALTELLNLLKE